MKIKISKIKNAIFLDEVHVQDKCIRVGWFTKNCPNMAMAMFYGWENASGSALIEGKNLKKIYPAIVGYYDKM